jgi:hypothetical protein
MELNGKKKLRKPAQRISPTCDAEGIRLVATKSISPSRKSSNGIIKAFQIVAKGHNETYEIANPVEHTTAAKDVKGEHVSENGGT